MACSCSALVSHMLHTVKRAHYWIGKPSFIISPSLSSFFSLFVCLFYVCVCWQLATLLDYCQRDSELYLFYNFQYWWCIFRCDYVLKWCSSIYHLSNDYQYADTHTHTLTRTTISEKQISLMTRIAQVNNKYFRHAVIHSIVHGLKMNKFVQ